MAAKVKIAVKSPMNRPVFRGRLQQVTFHLEQASKRLEEVVEIPPDLTREEVLELLGIANWLLKLELDFGRIERASREKREEAEKQEKCRRVGEQTTPVGGIH